MRWAGIAAASIAGAVDVLYLGVVGSQGANPQFLRVPFVATFIAVMAICAALSARASAQRWRPFLLGVASAGLLLLGYFGIFSIGLPLLAAGLLALISLISALRRSSPAPRTSIRAAAGMAAGGALLAVIVVLVGVTMTELAIRCPVHGFESGSGTSFLGGSYQYNCDNGKLTISR